MYVLPLIGISRQAYREAVHTGKELDWCCKSCTESSYISAEPVAESSRLEMSTIYEPLHPPIIEVSRGPHLTQFLQQQFEGSTVGKKYFIYLFIIDMYCKPIKTEKKFLKNSQRQVIWRVIDLSVFL